MSNLRILVAEDESIVAKNIQNRLKRFGYAVPAVVSTGEEAVLKAEELRPDLVLMDIVLKGRVDGIMAAEQIYSRLNIPIIYLTAYADDDTIQRAKLTEAYGYIHKPFDVRELRSAIEIAFFKHSAVSRVREEKNWLASTLKSVSDAVIVTDAQGLVTFINPPADLLVGLRGEDALDEDLGVLLNLIDEKTNDPAENPITRVLERDDVFIPENRITIVARDGSRNSVELIAAPVKDEMGEISAIIVVLRTVRENKKDSQEAGAAKSKNDEGINKSKCVSLMVATSSDMVREGMSKMLEPEQNVKIVVEALNQSQILPLAMENRPNILILDTAMPGLNLAEILDAIVDSKTGTKVILLLRVLDERLIINSISMGVRGYLSDTADREELLQAISSVNEDKIWTDVEVTTKLLNRLIPPRKGVPELHRPELTRREQDIAKLVVLGYSNKKISARLHISEKTVKSHLRNIFKKLDVDSRFQLAVHYQSTTSRKS